MGGCSHWDASKEYGGGGVIPEIVAERSRDWEGDTREWKLRRGWRSLCAWVGVGGGDMEWQGQCALCPCVMRLSLSLLLILPMLLSPVSGEEIFMGRPEQGSAWELPLKHAACDPFTLVGYHIPLCLFSQVPSSDPWLRTPTY